jgi:tetratricopeptide (TPR) repeat protein
LYRSAIESFQNAILSTEKNKSETEISDLSYLALARIAYESGDYDAAVYYYRKMPSDSAKLPVAFYESAWTYFVNGDYTRALGTFQALHSPYFQHYFYPELWILEATLYLNICRYDLSEQAIGRFTEEVATLLPPLEEFLRTVRTPADFYSAIVDTANGAKQQLPKKLVYPVLANAEFYGLYKTVRQIESEERELGRTASQLGAFGQELSAKLQTLKQSKVNELGIKIQQVLKKTQAEIQEYAIKVTEIQVDLDAQKLQQLDVDIRKLGGESVEEAEKSAEGSGGAAIVGADSLQWSFEGEYWRDEVGAYRSFIQERCTK